MIGIVTNPRGVFDDFLGYLRQKPCRHLDLFRALLTEAREANKDEPRTLAVLDWIEANVKRMRS